MPDAGRADAGKSLPGDETENGDFSGGTWLGAAVYFI
jgi:hypothetical protein